MYSDRRGRGGRDGGFGGGGFGRRDGGGGGGYGDQYGQRWDRNSGGGGGSASSEMMVDQRHVGRIIGKGGSKIRELQDTSGANIKVNSREVEDGKVRIVLSGSDESCQHAEDLIRDITTFFNEGGQYGGDRGGGRGGGGGGGWRRDDGGSYEGGGRRTCYKCGGEGHFARDCTSADSYQQGQRKSSTCYRCGEEGHMARDCQGGY